MRKKLVFNNGHNNYSIDKYYFQRDKNLLIKVLINIILNM